MVFFASAVFLVTVGGAAYYLLRSLRPKLTNQELNEIVKATPGLDGDNIVFEAIPGKLKQPEKEQVQRAFLKGPDMRWIYAGQEKDALLEGSDKSKQQGHQDLTYYLINCMLTFLASYGTTIVARDKTSQEFLGTFSLIPPYKRNWLFKLHFLATVIPLGKPVPVQQGKEQAARFDAFGEGYSQLKKEASGGTAHWAIEVVAVADNVQGRGIGRKLMTLAKAIVDHDNTAPAFLACHDENLPFYQKMGFTKRSRVFYTPKGIVDDSAFPYNGLTYSASQVEKQ